jgi:hypothetical protein
VSGSEERMVRDLNDRLYALLSDLRAPDADFACECGEAACRRSVALTLQEYATLRVQAGRAVLSAEHAGRRQRETGATASAATSLPALRQGTRSR